MNFGALYLTKMGVVRRYRFAPETIVNVVVKNDITKMLINFTNMGVVRRYAFAPKTTVKGR